MIQHWTQEKIHGFQKLVNQPKMPRAQYASCNILQLASFQKGLFQSPTKGLSFKDQSVVSKKGTNIKPDIWE